MKIPSATNTGVTKAQYEKVSNHLLPVLEQGLPTHLAYHNFGHILSVIRDSRYLMEKEGVPKEDMWFVLTAALFHDSGFIRTYVNHEEMSCNIARETLPQYGYPSDVIEAICQMIMATKIPQQPLDWYGQILCDADLFYLGTDSFLSIGSTLFTELKAIGFIKTEREWDEKQLNFLHQHRYFTQTAVAELEPKKKFNVKALEEKWK